LRYSLIFGAKCKIQAGQNANENLKTEQITQQNYKANQTKQQNYELAKQAEKRKETSNDYFKKAKELLSKSESFRTCGAQEESDLLTSIGQSIISCSGGDLESALNYYRQSESKAKKVEERELGSTKCLSKDKIKGIIKEAKNYKRTGDTYIGCSQAMMEKAELEDKLEEVRETAEKAKKAAQQAQIDAINAQSAAQQARNNQFR
jgi:hypothetical protein